MKNVVLLAQRDLKIYATSIVAYVVTAVFLAVFGFFFWAIMVSISNYCLQAMSNPMLAEQINFSDMFLGTLTGNVGVILLMLLPLVTMRTFSEEKKSGTFELLFTYPIRDWEIVVGKYLASAGALFVLTFSVLIHIALAIAVGGKLDWPQLVTTFVGLNLLGLCFLSLGLFASSLTENQIVAAITAFGFLLIFWVIGWTSELVSGAWSHALKGLSFFFHAENLYKGIIDTQDILFYVLFIAFFLFATLRVLEVRKWRG